MVLGDGSVSRLIKICESRHIFRITSTHHLAIVFYKDIELGAKKPNCNRGNSLLLGHTLQLKETQSVEQQPETYKEYINIIHKGAPTNLLKIRLSNLTETQRTGNLGEGENLMLFSKQL